MKDNSKYIMISLSPSISSNSFMEIKGNLRSVYRIIKTHLFQQLEDQISSFRRYKAKKSNNVQKQRLHSDEIL